MKDISTISMTALVASDFEERVSKAGKSYFTGELLFEPERAEEPIELRAFAFSNFPFRNGMPVRGDRVLIGAELSAERGGGLGLRVNSVQVIGQGEVPEPEGDDEELVF